VTPLPGAHFWIILAIGLRLRLDVPLAYLIANISIPPLMALFTLGEIEVGSFVRTGSFLGLTKVELAARGVSTYIVDVILGTAIVAPLVAMVGGLVTYGLALARMGRGSATTAYEKDAVDRVVDRYAASPLGIRMYVAAKLASDPVGEALENLAREEGGFGEVLDLGCGRGQFSLLLLEENLATRVRGIDWDDSKVAAANRAATDLDASFRQGDVRSAPLEEHDTVLLLDVLHYFAPEEQAAIVTRAARASRGRIAIRDIDPNRGFRSTLTRVQERLTTHRQYNRGERIAPRPISAVVRELEREGFAVTITPCWGKTPFANVLVVGTK